MSYSYLPVIGFQLMQNTTNRLGFWFSANAKHNKQAWFYAMVLEINLQKIYEFFIFEQIKQVISQTRIIVITVRNSDRDKIHELKKALMIITAKLLK